MKREILFRGLSKITDEWVSGYYTVIKGNEKNGFREGVILHHIDSEFVYKDSVGQYTGLKDKDGVKIFEGDVVEFDYNHLGNKIVEFKDGKYNICDNVLDKTTIISNTFEEGGKK